MSRLPRYVPGHITVIPAGIQWSAKVAGQYGLGVIFFWSSTHNSTSFPSRVHGLHGVACNGGEGYIGDLYPPAGPVLQALTPEAAYAMLGSRPITGPAATCFFSLTRIQGTGKH